MQKETPYTFDGRHTGLISVRCAVAEKLEERIAIKRIRSRATLLLG